MSKMDDAREASELRDKMRQPEKPTPSSWLGDSQHGGYASRARRMGSRVMCPECPASSINSTTWDARRELWACRHCGFTETPDERAFRLTQKEQESE